MVHPDKIEWVNDLTEKIRRGSGLVFTNFKGLTVAELRELRGELYEHDTRFHVVKNRLARRAFQKALNGETDGGNTPSDGTPSETPLEEISGLGPAKAEALQAVDIGSAEALLKADLDDLTAASGVGQATAEKFQANARELIGEAPDGGSGEDERDDDGDLLDRVEGYLNNNTAVAFCQNGFVGPAKVLIDFADEHEDLNLKGGLLHERVLDVDDLQRISELPSRRELLTTLARDLEAPIQRLARALSHPLQKLLRLLDGLREQREEDD